MNAFKKAWPAVIALVALLGCFLSQAQGADPVAPQPKIQFTALSHEFGKTSSNMELKHSFTFKNAGKAMLLIENVKAG
jgi:hypothetical protein